MSLVRGEKNQKRAEGAVLALAELRAGDKGRVEFLRTKDTKQLQQLMSIGVIPGVAIVLHQKFPAFVFSIGNSQFAVDKSLAQAIFVHIKR